MAQEAPWDEYLARAYLFATPHRSLAFKVQYLRERFERDETLTLGFQELETHRVPVGVGFFHPSGLSASVTATYWNQEGQFEQFGPDFLPIFVADTEEFWLVDLAVNLRLPKRYGFFSVGVANLFDKQFRYFEVEIDNPTIQPTRTVFARFTLAVP